MNCLKIFCKSGFATVPRSAFYQLLKLVFPSCCLICDEIIDNDTAFCHQCFGKLKFITEPKCKHCSLPFEVELINYPQSCSKCLVKKPSFDSVLTILVYDKNIAKIVSSLKYNKKIFLAQRIASLLNRRFNSEIIDCDIIAAVPIFHKKLRVREFNQSVLIAKKLGTKKLIVDLLRKVKDTKAQIDLDMEARKKNLKKAFMLNKKYHSLVDGKKILLVDDVMTTGSTLENCAKVLKKYGAKEVVVLVFARTVLK